MKLKTLEIKGFKSFANQTTIHFDENVIGIVGPNGSGKSNIVDAIRWVLGEQKSKELRLDQMSSVIFNGTKKRRASGMASVSLTFENTKNLLPTEYHTVTISRVLYQSGESEYRLNNVPCRLKDITSLFLDTGIGSNSYAIIALGMVDDILQDKENARRRMFEQAAGISKYKNRKKETLTKLKSTSDDLERVEDLLFEIEGNLSALEKQAKRTKRYFELKEQYKELSVQLAILKSSVIKEKQQQVNSQLQEQEDQNREMDIQIRKFEAELEKEKKANLDKEKALSDRQRELNQVVGKLRQMENDKQILQQKIEFAQQNEQKLNDQLQQAQFKISHLQEEIETYSQKVSAEKRKEAQLEDELVAAEEQLAKVKEKHGSLKADLDGIMQQQQAIEKNIIELEKRKAINQNQVQNLQSDLQLSLENADSRKEEMASLQEKIVAIEERETKLLEALKVLQLAENKRKSESEKTSQELEQVTRKLQTVNRNLDAKRNEYKLTKSMVESLEGFPESIKFLSQSKEWKKDAPLLSDLLYVQEDYRVAIENYLDPYLNYYVVQNLEEAYQAIKLLNKTQKGKANFFLLDAFNSYEPPMVMLPETTRATELIETEPQYRNLVSYLLENVLLSDREELHMNLDHDQITLLTRSGGLIQRKFSLSGGSVGLFEGKKIGRKKNLEVLETAIAQAEREENRLSTQYYNLKKKLEQLRQNTEEKDIQLQSQTLNKIAQEKVSFQTRMENFQNYMQENAERQQSINERIEALQNQNKSIEKELKSWQTQVQSTKEQIANTDGSYREIADALSLASNAFNQKNIEFIQQQNLVSSLQRELAFRERQLDENRVSHKSSQQGIEKAVLDQEETRQQIDQLTQTLQLAYQDRKLQEENLTGAEQLYFKARGRINELDDQIRKVNRKKQETQVLLNSLKEKQNDLRYQITAISERLQIEFQISINDVINEPLTTDLKQEELQMKVERLKNRLDNYGEINPMAVEAYDEINERYQSITTQRDDILKAKEDLLTTIQEIEETATTQFLEAFEQARLHFIEVFRSLFTADDRCDLILLDEENPLESKIEIVAKPKGKRPQAITQLSGGEKTLTATALLFALYLLKPAPFCIFDEVDAPLDDANIEKFNRIIKKFSVDSQFIIVTHNKQTMAAVDTIYGVFMQEQGVSAVNQVDFRSFGHTTLLEASN